MLGLLWNQWAGGASGFILGTFMHYWSNSYNGMAGSGTDMAYILSAMLIGYMAGALNKHSELSKILSQRNPQQPSACCSSASFNSQQRTSLRELLA
jgi:hypothetical protein